MPVPPPAARGEARDGEKAPVAAARSSSGPGVERKTAAHAIQVIGRPLLGGEAARVTVLGDSGVGKTCVVRELARVLGLALIHDDTKATPQYADSLVLATPAQLLELPVETLNETTAVSFRGDAFRGLVCEVDDVADLALQFARARIPCTLVVDELDRALTPGGQSMRALKLREALTQGRSMRLNVLATTQNPKRVPDDCINQATAIVFCRLGPKALNYIDGASLIDDELLDAVRNLRVDKDANDRVTYTEFVVHVPSTPWNRTVYYFAPGSPWV